VLLLASLASGTSTIRRPLIDADDSRVMIGAVRHLGAVVTEDELGLHVRGVAGRWRAGPGDVRLDLKNAGTAVRFLAAAALLSPGPIIIDGNARMRQRPLGELAECLRGLGCGVKYLGSSGFPPARIEPPETLPASPRLELDTTQSSQFISALLLVSPWLGGITIRLRGEVTSPSYISMTLGLLRRFGLQVQASQDLREINVKTSTPPASFTTDIEPDASGATYWWGAGALLAGSRVSVVGIGPDSLQGDAGFPTLLSRMGARVTSSDGPGVCVTGPERLSPIHADLSDMPDAAMTLAAVASFGAGTSVLTGLRTLRVKETDRIDALQRELAKIGVAARCPAGEPDALEITPPPGGVAPEGDVEFDTYDDHRMAMSLSLIGLRRNGVVIRNPACVGKTYPRFWSELARLFASPRGSESP